MSQETVQHPSRADRQKCWKVRDAFFACLDESKVLDPSAPEAASICKDLRNQYEGACMKSWVNEAISTSTRATASLGDIAFTLRYVAAAGP